MEYDMISQPNRELFIEPIAEMLYQHPGMHYEDEVAPALAEMFGLTSAQISQMYENRNERRTVHVKNTAFVLSEMHDMGITYSDGKGHWYVTEFAGKLRDDGVRITKENVRRFSGELAVC